MEMKKLALLGKDISHSLSPDLYREIYKDKNLNYQLIDIANSADLPSLAMLMKDLDGLNITSPYKEFYLNQVEISSNEIQSINAINCILKQSDRFFATNTDYLALKHLVPLMKKDLKIVILGDGVMSRVVQIVCKFLEIEFEQRSRRQDPELFTQFSNGKFVDENTLLINCCSRSYCFEGELGTNSHFWDLNYRHSHHQEYFKKTSSYTDGFSLLKLQAEKAAAFWSQLKN